MLGGLSSLVANQSPYVIFFVGIIALSYVSQVVCVEHSQFDINVVNIDGVCTVKRTGDEQELQDLYRAANWLVKRDYFRYFKVNLELDCPYWAVEIMCTGALTDEGEPIAPCTVCKCDENELPWAVTTDVVCGKDTPVSQPYTPLVQPHTAFFVKEKVDRSISKVDTRGWMFTWEDPDSVYVDLVRNPESNTGYIGEEAYRIWVAIYNENCFTSDFNDMCVEDRVFYRLISGLHTSISTHIAVHHTLQGNGYPTDEDQMTPDYHYAPDIDEFMRRVGHHEDRIDNLHLLHNFILRALHKAKPFLLNVPRFSGTSDDNYIYKELHEILNNKLINSPSFNETLFFREHTSKSTTLTQLKRRFMNITSLMDCLTCEKCRLWGKLQTLGLSTALKIVIADIPVTNLKRSEIMALFNLLRQVTLSVINVHAFMTAYWEDQPETACFAPFGLY